jgi:tRNA(Ile)-lysidine synthase
VAYSGGLDSTVLLHGLAAVRDALTAPLSAVHVHHGLHPDAGRWADHCWRACAALALPCEVVAVEARASPGESPEAAARDARYRALEALTGPGEAVLLAHHRDDQAETLLLRLLRGAGAEGLAGMPRVRPLGRGWTGRPLLDWPRAALAAWALGQGLAWLEDPGNRDPRYDRNFLRHEVLPLHERRWPGVAGVLARTAERQAELARLVGEVAEADLALARAPIAGALSVAALRALPIERRRLVLRHWLRARGLPVPPAPRLEEVARAVLEARADRTPCVRWTGVEVRRYRDLLTAGPPAAAPASSSRWGWAPPEPLALPWGTLAAEPAVGEGVAVRALAGEVLTVRLRRGGERCRLPGRACTQTLKKLLQEAGVPPWERQRLPLLYAGEALVAVAGRWVCVPFAAGPGEAGWRLRWSPGATRDAGRGESPDG